MKTYRSTHVVTNKKNSHIFIAECLFCYCLIHYVYIPHSLFLFIRHLSHSFTHFMVNMIITAMIREVKIYFQHTHCSSFQHNSVVEFLNDMEVFNFLRRLYCSFYNNFNLHMYQKCIMILLSPQPCHNL